MAQCKRKRGVAEQPAHMDATPTSKSQKLITAFAQVGKAQHIHDGAKKRKVVHGDNRTQRESPLSAPNGDRKRKRAGDAGESSNAPQAQPHIREVPREAEPPSTPTSKRTRRDLLVAPETPSRGAAALFDKLKIESRSAKRRPLPETLLQLQGIFSALLSALSLYYSHNGTASPVNVSALLPMITKHWRKRSVTLDDLRRVLAIARDTYETFSLEDYGRAGIRLTRVSKRGRAIQRSSSYINETELNAEFESALASLWDAWHQDSSNKENHNATAFLAHLPLQPIIANEVTQKAAPIFARGQQRLAEIKAAAVVAPAASKFATNNLSASTTPTTSASSTPAAPSTLQTRKSALLDRILTKQSHLSTLPAAPSKALLDRRSALHRIEEVSRALSLLTSGKQERCSFSVAVVTQRLQQSLRNPISRQEAEQCLELMAEEVVPGFVKLVAMGGGGGGGAAKGVVVARSAAVEVGELRRRVEEAVRRQVS